MFSNPGEKLRVLAYLVFALELIGALVIFVMGVIQFFGNGAGGLLLMLYAAILAFAAWISTIVILALAEAAEYASEAAAFAANAAHSAEAIIHRLDEVLATEEEKIVAAMPTNVDGKIPAWQRIEIEKEAAQKAET